MREVQVRTNAQEIDHNRDDVPEYNGPRNDEQPVVDPEDLEDAHVAAMRGFMPALDWRLSIAIKSGSAANVVPKPVSRPMTSER